MKRFKMPYICISFLIGSFLLSPYCTASAKKKNVIELKFAHFIPPRPNFSTDVWAREVEKRSNGRVKITIYWGGSLVKIPQLRKAVVRGIADMSFLGIDFDPTAYKLNSVVGLPFLGFPSARVATRIRDELIENIPEVKAEFNGTEILSQTVVSSQMIHTAKKAIHTFKDLKGQKIVGAGVTAKTLEVLGATAVSLNPMETYMALERGVADGWLTGAGGVLAFRCIKKLTCHNKTVVNYVAGHAIMNQKKFLSLPTDIQKIFMDLRPVFTKLDLQMALREDTQFWKEAKKLNHTMTESTPKEYERLQELVKPIHEEWITKREANGLPARAVYKETLKLIKKYSDQTNPVKRP